MSELPESVVKHVEQEDQLAYMPPLSRYRPVPAIALGLGGMSSQDDRDTSCFEEDEEDEEDSADIATGGGNPDDSLSKLQRWAQVTLGKSSGSATLEPERARPRARRGSVAADDRARLLGSTQDGLLPPSLSLSRSSPDSFTQQLEQMVSEPHDPLNPSRLTVPRFRSVQQMMVPREFRRAKGTLLTRDVSTNLLPVNTIPELRSHPDTAQKVYINMLSSAVDCLRTQRYLDSMGMGRSHSQPPEDPSALRRQAVHTSSRISSQSRVQQGRDTVLQQNRALAEQCPNLHVSRLTKDSIEDLGQEALNSELASLLSGYWQDSTSPRTRKSGLRRSASSASYGPTR